MDGANAQSPFRNRKGLSEFGSQSQHPSCKAKELFTVTFKQSFKVAEGYTRNAFLKQYQV